MTWLHDRLVRDERGSGQLPYIVISLVCSTFVFRPDLLAAAYFRLADLCSLFVSQLGFLY